MQKLSEIVPTRGKVVELCLGDITELDPSEDIDVLVVSAFPDDYRPTPSSVIGALSRKGLDVGRLARDKAVDLRKNFACWMSHDVKGSWPFKRIMCFEPWGKGSPPDVVSDIFRSLAPFVADPEGVRRVALPLVAAGDQGTEPEDMLRPLVGAACEWMKRGFSLDKLQIVVRDPQVASCLAPVCDELRRQHEAPPAVAAPQSRALYDVFISYSRHDSASADIVAETLLASRPDLRIFVDRFELKPGCFWRTEIVQALDDCRRIVPLYSPEYLASKMCQEEFNIAWMRRDDDASVLFPIYLRSAALPNYMRLVQYIDCREADEARLQTAAEALLSAL